MKAIIHLKNEDYFCHPAIGVEVELPARPVVGDVLYLSEDGRKELTRQIEEWADRHGITEDRNPYWELYSGRYGWNGMESVIYVSGVAFRPDRDEKTYELHVDLSENEPKYCKR